MTLTTKATKTHLVKTLMVSALALTVAACGGDNTGSAIDESTKSAAVESAKQKADSYSGQDWSTHYSGTDVKDGVVMGDLIIGNPDAPIELVEYASLTCPHCAKFHTEMLPEIKETMIKTGQVKLHFRNYIFNGTDLEASKLVRCTGADRASAMLGYLFKTQQTWAQDPKAELVKAGRTAGLNRAKFDACMANTDLTNSLMDMTKRAVNEGVTGTPTFFVNGTKVENVRDAAELMVHLQSAQ